MIAPPDALSAQKAKAYIWEGESVRVRDGRAVGS